MAGSKIYAGKVMQVDPLSPLYQRSLDGGAHYLVHVLAEGVRWLIPSRTEPGEGDTVHFEPDPSGRVEGRLVPAPDEAVARRVVRVERYSKSEERVYLDGPNGMWKYLIAPIGTYLLGDEAEAGEGTCKVPVDRLPEPASQRVSPHLMPMGARAGRVVSVGPLADPTEEERRYGCVVLQILTADSDRFFVVAAGACWEGAEVHLDTRGATPRLVEKATVISVGDTGDSMAVSYHGRYHTIVRRGRFYVGQEVWVRADRPGCLSAPGLHLASPGIAFLASA